jgi:hypothetical protein
MAIDLIACAPVSLTVEPASLTVEPASLTVEAALDAPLLDAAPARPRVRDAVDLLDPEERLGLAPRPREPAAGLERRLPPLELPDAPPALRELGLRELPLAEPPAPRELPALREPPLEPRELPLARPAGPPLLAEPEREDFVLAAEFPFGDDRSLVLRALWLVEAMTYLPHRLHLSPLTRAKKQNIKFAGASL